MRSTKEKAAIVREGRKRKSRKHASTLESHDISDEKRHQILSNTATLMIQILTEKCHQASIGIPIQLDKSCYVMYCIIKGGLLIRVRMKLEKGVKISVTRRWLLRKIGTILQDN